MRIKGLLLLVVIVLGGCGQGAPPPTVTPRSDYRLGLVTDVGSIRDGTFIEFAHRGALRASQQYGLDYTYRESINDSHYEIYLADLLADQRNIIITVGFFMTDFTLEAAQANPDVYFIGVDQFYAEAPANLIGLQFREDEGGFLAGALAGMMTETGVVGMVAGEPIPPVERFVNGFRNGVQYTNPEAEVLQVYGPSFVDSEYGRETAADWVLNEHVDVLFGAGGITGSSAIFEAASLGAWVIGVDQDEYRTTFGDGMLEGAGLLLTSAVKRVDHGVYQAIVSVLAGTFAGGVVTLSAADCGVGYAPFHEAGIAIPDAVEARLEAIWRGLAGSTLHTGADDDGTEAPQPLGDGEPPVAADAPTLASCEID